MVAFRDDLDLCWRTHLTGGRVLVVPQSRVRHFAAASSRSRRTKAVGHPRYLIERHTLAAMLKATSLRKLPLALLLAMVGALVRSASLALTGRPADALAVLWAWGWNVKELPVTIVHRRRLQRQRKVDDSALAPLRAPGGQRLRALLRGTLELVYGAEVGAHVAQRTDDSGEEQDMPSGGVSVLRVIAGHPVAFMVGGFALVMAISLRSVLFAPAIASVSLGVWPATATELVREFISSFHRAQMGSTASAPPSLALLGGLSVLTFGKALVAEKLLLWLALPLAAATCTRALRVVVPQLWARALAGLLYATAPLATGALAQGRIGELVLLVLAPPALAQVVLAFRAEQPREPCARPCASPSWPPWPSRSALRRRSPSGWWWSPPSWSPWPARVPTVAGWPPASRCTWPPGSGWPWRSCCRGAGGCSPGPSSPTSAVPWSRRGWPTCSSCGRAAAGCPARWSGRCTRLWPWPPCSSPPPPAAAFRRLRVRAFPGRGRRSESIRASRARRSPPCARAASAAS